VRSKHTNAYETAFAVLEIVCKGHNIAMNPASLMSDFEGALRNVLREAFPEVEVKDVTSSFVNAYGDMLQHTI